jgi:hypothetical protein
MRKASTLIGLTLVALGAKVRAGEAAAVAPAPPPVVVAPAPPPPFVAPPPAAPMPDPAAGPTVVAVVPAASLDARPPRRIELGLALLPMAVGKFTTPIGAKEATAGAAFAYGVGLSAAYRMMAGLTLGVAPQLIANVKYKVYPSQLTPPPAAREYDFMARVAYTQPVVEAIAVYVEALPGYSFIAVPGAVAQGFVLAAGAGVLMDMTDRVFANVGAGYQRGFQSVSQSGMTLDNSTRYLRVALGGGVRF